MKDAQGWEPSYVLSRPAAMEERPPWECSIEDGFPVCNPRILQGMPTFPVWINMKSVILNVNILLSPRTLKI